MDFDDRPEDAVWREQCRTWIRANRPDIESLPRGEDVMGQPAHYAMARKWQALKAANGYVCISWPEEWGGRNGTALQQAIFDQEEKAAGIAFTYFMPGLGTCLPAVMQFCDTATRERIRDRAISGQDLWVQLFSEPSGGSDVASARTRAVRDEATGDWIINGQKVWTSMATLGDYGLLVTRTDPDVVKHKGLTLFWVDLKTPGLEIVPIHQMTDEYEFCEVFFNDMRIPDSQRVGEINGGWQVVLATLMNERLTLSGPVGISWPDIMRIASQVPAENGGTVLDDPAFRERLAEYYVTTEGVRLMAFRTLTSAAKGTAPGPEGSMGKLLWATQTQALTNHALEIQGSAGLIDDLNGPFDDAIQHRWLWAPGLRLGGGTDEILRNIVGERLLGLPGEPRLDKVPFRDIPGA
jgi:alkylation response protein AidB-like acyl-CoA dehydrogenase